MKSFELTNLSTYNIRMRVMPVEVQLKRYDRKMKEPENVHFSQLNIDLNFLEITQKRIENLQATRCHRSKTMFRISQIL